jgi:membrane-associated phospholipid phosphatase
MEFLHFLAQFRTPSLTFLFRLFTYLGEEIITITVICFLYWCYDKQLARKVCVAYFASGLLVQSLKLTFCIPRPWILDSTFEPSESMLHSATGYSFPSGHTQSSSSLFGSFAFAAKKSWLRILSVILIIGVAFSRMFLGYHTLKDVLVSMGISLFIVFLVNQVVDISTYESKKTAISLAIFSTTILIYTLTLKNLPNADLTQFHDGFKAIGAGLGFALGWYVEPLYINFDEKKGSRLVQVLKLSAGLVIAVFLKSGLKVILGTSLTADTIRYFILVCFIMILYPIIIMKLNHKANQESR